MKASIRTVTLPGTYPVVAHSFLFLCALLPLPGVAQTTTDLQNARDRGDQAAIDSMIAQAEAAAKSGNSAEAQYKLALAYSYGAEVAMEKHDKKKSESLAEKGLDPAQKAVSANSGNAEYHRLEGALCGQVIPANPLMGTLKYGQCARDEINKAIELNPKLALAYVTRGVGNFYLPSSMGGGVDVAVKDLDKAISLEPKLADAYLWKGVTLHKANKNAEARQALDEAAKLAPNRVWIKEQLQKLPPQ